jgi:hypothetical protein
MQLYRMYNGYVFWTWDSTNRYWKWSKHDEHTYCLKAIQAEKSQFNIDIDCDYKSDGKIEDLVKELKNNADKEKKKK